MSTSHPGAPRPARLRRRGAALALAASVLVGCTSGESAGTTTDSSAPQATADAGSSGSSPTTQAAGSGRRRAVDLESFELRSPAEGIWAATGDRTVCSPAEPSAAVLEFGPLDPSGGAGDAERLAVSMVWWQTPSGTVRREVLRLAAGVWTGSFGPLRATARMTDTVVPLTVVGFDDEALAAFDLDPADITALRRAVRSDRSEAIPADARAAVETLSAALDELDEPGAGDDVDSVVAAATAAAAGEVTVLAPEPCAAGASRDRRGRSRTNAELTVQLGDEATDAIEIWATASGACPAGPTSFEFTAETTGAPDGLRARWTLPSGATGESALRREGSADGVQTWRGRLGPFDASRSMPESAELPVSVMARLGEDEATASTVLVVRRPAPCAGATTSTSSIDGTATGTDPGATAENASLETSVNVAEIWATGDGLCAAGPVSAGVRARTTGPVTSVDARVVRSGGAVVTSVTLTASSAGVWTGTVGPIAAVSSMPDSSALTVEFAARGGGRTITDTASLTLRRPARCTADPTATSAPSSPTTASPTATTPAPAGTTAPPAETGALTVSGSVSGSELWATAAGRCPAGATSLTLNARTTGAVAEVQVRVLAPNGSLITTVALGSTGAGQWRGTLGPIAGSQGMADASTLTLQFGARSGGTNDSSSTTVTLRRPPACPTDPAPTTEPTPVTPAPTVAPTPAPTPPPTAAPATAPPTVAATTAVAVTVDGSVNGSQLSAVIDGGCATAPTSLSIGARTTGAVSEVQARVTLANGSVAQTVTLSPAGDGRWSATIGPITGSVEMPQSSQLTVQFGARGGGASATSSSTVTLLRPERC